MKRARENRPWTQYYAPKVIDPNKISIVWTDQGPYASEPRQQRKDLFMGAFKAGQAGKSSRSRLQLSKSILDILCVGG